MDALSDRPLCRALAFVCALGLSVVVAAANAADPAPTPDGEPSAEALVGEIPFHPQTPLGRVLIDLAPEGQRPFVLMLDTGAASTVLTPRVARALGVSVRRTKSSHYRKATRLGRDLLFWVDVSASDTGVGGGGFEYGLLGSDFLDDYVLEIDHPGRMVRFWDPEKYAVPERHPSPDVHVLPFERNGRRMLVDVELEGHAFEALLDTGAPSILIAKKHATAAGIARADFEEEITIAYVNGPSKNRVYQTKEMRLGGLLLPSMPILIELKSPMNLPGGALIGYDAVGRYKMRIDYARKRISLGDPGSDGPVFASWLDAYRASRFDRDIERPTDEEIAANDALRRAEFEKKKNERVYARTPGGGFMVVEGYRLREGPKEGETWYTHEEMLATRDADEGSDSGREAAAP